MRVFVAINPTAKEQGRVWRASRNLREQDYPMRWAWPENIHITLKFLGEVEDKHVSEVSAAVDRAVSGFDVFQLVVRGFGAFPSLRRPQVLWAGVEANRTLQSVHDQLEGALEGLGFAREKRSFHPHLTLARAKRGARAGDLRGLSELVGKIEYTGRFEVRSIDVMRSQLTRSGAVYDVAHSSSLGTSTDS